MKLKINKACDLNSISVLPPHSRRPNVIGSGTDSSVFGKSQASQLRSQQSQQSFSQGMSSQLSQNSLDDIQTNEQRFGSQERENSAKRMSCLAPISFAREETQVQISRSSNNAIRRWSSASAIEHKCQVSEELEHRVGLMETSLSRFGMILDSIQSDVMQVNRAIKEVSLETEGVRQKLLGHDNSLQLMLKGEEDLKASLDGSFKSIPDQLRKDLNQCKLQEAVSVILTLPVQIEAQLLKLQSELCEAFTKQIEATVIKMKPSDNKDSIPSNLPSKRRDCWVYQPQKKQAVMDNPMVPPSVCTQKAPTPKIKMESRDRVKPEPSSFTNKQRTIKYKQREVPFIELDREWRIIIESDEEIDEGFSCLLKEKERGAGNCLADDVKGDAERILRKARRRKRKHCNQTILL